MFIITDSKTYVQPKTRCTFRTGQKTDHIIFIILKGVNKQ